MSRLYLLSRSTDYIRVIVLHCSNAVHPCTYVKSTGLPTETEQPSCREKHRSCASCAHDIRASMHVNSQKRSNSFHRDPMIPALSQWLG